MKTKDQQFSLLTILTGLKFAAELLELITSKNIGLQNSLCKRLRDSRVNNIGLLVPMDEDGENIVVLLSNKLKTSNIIKNRRRVSRRYYVSKEVINDSII